MYKFINHEIFISIKMKFKYKIIFVEILESQRQYLSELNKDTSINKEVFRRHLYLIDLKEERLKMLEKNKFWAGKLQG